MIKTKKISGFLAALSIDLKAIWKMSAKSTRNAKWAGGLLAVGLLTIIYGSQPQAGEVYKAETHLRQMLERLSSGGNLYVEQIRIRARDFYLQFYQARQFRPAWTDPKDVRDLIDGLKSTQNDGLLIEDFHYATVVRLQKFEGLNPIQIAERDILFTDALAIMANQLFYGKVNPTSLDADWNIEKPLFRGEPVKVLENALRDDMLLPLIGSLRSQSPSYKKLRKALEGERKSSQRPQVNVPGGPTMGLGDDGIRVAALRSRLGLAEGTLFNKVVEVAVLAFQRSKRLSSDGRVGKQTLAALNIGPKQRIETLRVNLERARWLRDIGLDEKFIAVNIAGFRVYLIENGNISWQTRAVVGKTYHKTPLFTANMKYLVLNPTWTPTPNILRNETVPKARRDPGYLASKNYAVFDKSGSKIDPGKVDWSNYRQYRIVQQPGPGNALGQVKFIFPNKHFVYLHDTPSRSLFGEKSRAFSHGCIRIENPLELARRLLADRKKWTSEAIDRVLKTGRTATVHLRKPIPVYLLYWTANPLREGAEIEYLPDVYGRDGAILKALDRPFSAGRS